MLLLGSMALAGLLLQCHAAVAHRLEVERQLHTKTGFQTQEDFCLLLLDQPLTPKDQASGLRGRALGCPNMSRQQPARRGGGNQPQGV